MDNTTKRYAVDEIIEDIVILEDIETKEKIIENINYLPENIKDGNILLYEGEEYVIDESFENDRRRMLRERLERLKALKRNDDEEEEYEEWL